MFSEEIDRADCDREHMIVIMVTKVLAIMTNIFSLHIDKTLWVFSKLILRQLDRNRSV